jgi:Mg-chelatase subunit ChlI
MDRIHFPFSAIVGQQLMKTALILNAVDPSIGGVLIRGQKGTGKTTAVRSLQAVLPSIRVVKGCPYRCSPDEPERMHGECRALAERGLPLEAEEIPTPLVDLPLNATEDRLVGTLHIEEALRSGSRRFEPGLLAAANRGILYIDEVNLLEDHLVDMLLDAAATGVNQVEREGLSYSHPSRFMLVGTMNPEEGELRPQFLDRFGLCLSVTGVSGERDRLDILRRRMAFERSPETFEKIWEGENRVLAAQIVLARRRLPEVSLGDAALELIVRIASDAGTAGHRAEIAMMKTAAALAAFTESDRVLPFHIGEAARLVLPHRMNLGPLHGADAAVGRIDTLVKASRTGRGETGSDSRDPGEAGIEPGEGQGAFEPSAEYAEEFGVDPAALEEMQVPGSTAAGSIMFSFLKKKLRTTEASLKK